MGSKLTAQQKKLEQEHAAQQLAKSNNAPPNASKSGKCKPIVAVVYSESYYS